MFISLIRSEGNIYVVTDKEGNIIGFNEKERMMLYWTRGWERGLNMGAGFSTAAMLSFIDVQPSVIEVADVEDIQTRILGDPLDPGGYTLYDITGMGAFYNGVLCQAEGVEDVMEGGSSPEFFRDEALR